MIPPCIVTDKIHILPFLAINKQKTTPQNPIIYVYLKVFRSLLFLKPCHHSCTFENLKHALSSLHNSYTPRFQSQRKKKKKHASTVSVSELIKGSVLEHRTICAEQGVKQPSQDEAKQEKTKCSKCLQTVSEER